jgi:sterol desaturase/sphingolipid hydroxylase (fatty acid hydroxylase superfamily)
VTSPIENLFARLSGLVGLSPNLDLPGAYGGGGLADAFGSIALILAAMALIAIIEGAIPLHARGRLNRAHLVPNLALTFMTFATNALMNTALVLALYWLQNAGYGIQYWLGAPPFVAMILTVLALDFSYYVLHVAMHKVPAFWRYHLVHHCDPAVDVTTTIRQHPGESVLRHIALALTAGAMGAAPAAFALYRLWSALNGLLEHADIRVPLWLDRILAFVTTWPYMHKIHHSRDWRQTDTNYGNIFSFWDRLFSTFTPSAHGENIAYGLDGTDDPSTQSIKGLLALPFRGGRRPTSAAAE